MDASRAALENAINALDLTVGQAVTYFRTQMTVPSQEWGPKEVLSHLLHWHGWTLQSFEGVAQGRAALRQPPTMAEIDQLNASAVAERKDREVVDLANDLADLQRRLVAAARALPDPNAIVAIRMDGSELPAPNRLEMMNHHIGNHLEELRGS